MEYLHVPDTVKIASYILTHLTLKQPMLNGMRHKRLSSHAWPHECHLNSDCNSKAHTRRGSIIA